MLQSVFEFELVSWLAAEVVEDRDPSLADLIRAGGLRGVAWVNGAVIDAESRMSREASDVLAVMNARVERGAMPPDELTLLSSRYVLGEFLEKNGESAAAAAIREGRISVDPYYQAVGNRLHTAISRLLTNEHWNPANTFVIYSTLLDRWTAAAFIDDAGEPTLSRDLRNGERVATDWYSARLWEAIDNAREANPSIPNVRADHRAKLNPEQQREVNAQICAAISSTLGVECRAITDVHVRRGLEGMREALAQFARKEAPPNLSLVS